MVNPKYYRTDASQVQRSADKALAEVEWSDEGENVEEDEGEMI